jgi:hypothetical protein
MTIAAAIGKNGEFVSASSSALAGDHLCEAVAATP